MASEAPTTAGGGEGLLTAQGLLGTASPTGLAVTQFVIGVFLITSNIIALFVIIRSNLAWFRPSIFILHLVMCDLYRGLVLIISSLYTLRATDVIRENPSACRVIGFFIISSTTMNSYAVPLLFYDRLLFVSSPVNYTFRMTKKLVGILIVFNILQSVILAAIPFNGWGEYEYSGLFATCSLKWKDSGGYPVLVVVWIHFIPMVASLVCFVKLVFWMRRRICRVRMNASVKLTWNMMRDYNFRETNLPMQAIGKTLFLVLVFYYLSWFPYFFFIILAIAGLVVSSQAYIAYAILASLSLVTSVVNPWLYWMPNRKFRRNAKHLFPCSDPKTAYLETDVSHISRSRSESLFVLRDYPLVTKDQSDATRC